jgi:hypothetical protein
MVDKLIEVRNAEQKRRGELASAGKRESSKANKACIYGEEYDVNFILPPMSCINVPIVFFFSYSTTVPSCVTIVNSQMMFIVSSLQEDTVNDVIEAYQKCNGVKKDKKNKNKTEAKSNEGKNLMGSAVRYTYTCITKLPQL